MGKAPYALISLNADSALASLDDLRERFRDVPEKLNRAFVNALNKAKVPVEKKALELVQRRYYGKLSMARFRQAVTVVRASKNKPFIIMRVEGRGARLLSSYPHEGNVPGRGGREARAAVLRGNPLQPLVKGKRKGFVMKGRGGTPLLATRMEGETVRREYTYMTKHGERTGMRKDETIRVFFGPTFLRYLEQPIPQSEISKVAKKVFFKNFGHQARFALGDIKDTRGRS